MGIDPANLTDPLLRCMAPGDRKKLGKAGMTQAEVLHRVITRIESKIHDLVINFCNRHKIPYGHSATNMKCSIQSGEPDFHFKRQPDFYVEIKVPPNVLTADQAIRIGYLRENGNTVLVITDELDELGRSTGKAYREICAALRKQYNLTEGLE